MAKQARAVKLTSYQYYILEVGAALLGPYQLTPSTFLIVNIYQSKTTGEGKQIELV